MKASIVMDLFQIAIVSCGVLYLIKNSANIKTKAQQIATNLKNCCMNQK